MIYQRDFNLPAYQALPIVQIAQNNSKLRASVLEDIAHLLRRYHLQNQFGISILHKHFDITTDEALVRRLNGDNIRINVERPCGDLVACHWKADPTSSDDSFVPLEFLDRNSFTQQEIEMSELFASEECSNFRREFFETVIAASAANDIGLMTLHANSALSVDLSNTTLLEESYDNSRLSVVRTAPRSASKNGDYFQALWVADPADGTSSELSCSYHCRCDQL